MKKLTVFTSTYNRAYCLDNLYTSLCAQTCRNFKWLIIDDGSTDNTREIIEKWIAENGIEIKYVYKQNGGMHSGHNKAYEIIDTEFNVCIDSDDSMPVDAVETIVSETDNLPASFAGIVGLDIDKKGYVIGTEIPDYLFKCKLNELYLLHKVKGDKKLVYRTSILRNYPPYPEFSGEKFVPLDYKYLLIDQDYDLKPVNKALCIVEYQGDGSTLNIFKQYRKNPNGFAFSRISRIKYGRTIAERVKNAIHLVSSSIFAKEKKWLFKTDKTGLVLAAIPFGVLLNLYVRLKSK